MLSPVSPIDNRFNDYSEIIPSIPQSIPSPSLATGLNEVTTL
jgi:hypothetical protein